MTTDYGFKLKKSKRGFVDIITDDVPIEDCIICATESIPGLHILPPGRGTRNPNALYNSKKVEDLFAELRKHYDYIIIDCPPLSFGSEFLHIAKHLDGYAINLRAGVTLKGSLANLMKELSFIDAPLLGFIYYGVISKNQSSYGNYGYGKKYNSYYYYYGSRNSKTQYKEAKGSYKKYYKEELGKRNKSRPGTKEPVLAYAKGTFENSVISTAKEAAKDTVKETAKDTKKGSGKQRTMDMLSEIENMDKKS